MTRDLGWSSLQSPRKVHDLKLFYKICSGVVIIPNSFPPNAEPGPANNIIEHPFIHAPQPLFETGQTFGATSLNISIVLWPAKPFARKHDNVALVKSFVHAQNNLKIFIWHSKHGLVPCVISLNLRTMLLMYPFSSLRFIHARAFPTPMAKMARHLRAICRFIVHTICNRKKMAHDAKLTKNKRPPTMLAVVAFVCMHHATSGG